ncbi:SDR family oxidoreductase [Streptomyces sp. NA02950]|uniref:SDR family NAD(P)-dependent oxidoreductase n=1 Tax=Streptomyces sp. NA02950 TaxID=2742137 RepID=UPI0015913697|nr:SDR family oxidoreductase [Streptomyces sp. NA02950]QKV96215.1 SDR family oxidoreductase [Streptomyces sp. NA02950]
MELKDAGVVVTGAGSGIGAALARRFAAAGARVVVNDLDAAAAARVAEEVGGLAVFGDASAERDVAALVAAARTHLGEIDLFCANAGIEPGGGADAPEEVWERVWQVNVMSHVRVVRELLGPWLERGRGHLLATVSSAGLLTHPAAAPYAVSKHGALAFAEWLAATYAHRGITVQALCPMGVRTEMYERSDPAAKALGGMVLTPEEVADTAAEALADGQFLILPHPEVRDHYAGRATDTDRWLSGVRRLQQQMEEISAQV